MGLVIALAGLVITVLVAFLHYFGRRSFKRLHDQERILLNLKVCKDCLDNMAKRWLKGAREHIIEDKHFGYSDIRLDIESKDLFEKLEEARRRLRQKKDKNSGAVVTPEFMKAMYQEREAFRKILKSYPESRDLLFEIEKTVFTLLEREDFPKPDIEIKSFFRE